MHHTYEKEGPFLLYVAYNAPHTPLQAQEKDIELYCDDFGSLTPKEQKRVTYQAMVSCMDRGIGTIVDALKKKGIMDNTFLIFFSDNGPAGVPGSHPANYGAGSLTNGTEVCVCRLSFIGKGRKVTIRI